jgi:methylated-DNA-[protein]-cysteine S-methyltransferase
MAYGFALFETSIGACGVVWGGKGLLGLQLPETDQARTRARVLRRWPQAREVPPPAGVQRALDRITALLRGEASDLSAIPLDMEDVPEFNRRVYEVARTVPPGATITYGEIATRLGDPQDARAVGEAMGRNPFAIVVPCHRVVAANGKMGGFSANGGVATKQRMLIIEGALKPPPPTLFDNTIWGGSS